MLATYHIFIEDIENIMIYSDIQILALVIFLGKALNAWLPGTQCARSPAAHWGQTGTGTGSICMGMSWKHFYLCTQMVAFSSKIRWLSTHNHLFQQRWLVDMMIHHLNSIDYCWIRRRCQHCQGKWPCRSQAGCRDGSKNGVDVWTTHTEAEHLRKSHGKLQVHDSGSCLHVPACSYRINMFGCLHRLVWVWHDMIWQFIWL